MKFNKKHLFLVAFLPIQIVLVQFLSKKTEFIENYYSNGFYPFISKLLRILLGWLPFSFGDVLGLVLIYLLIKSIYKLIKNRFKNFVPQIIKFTAILSVIYFCFYTFWGLNYFREPLAKNLKLSQANYSDSALISTTKYVIEKLNTVHTSITGNDTVMLNVPYSKKEIYKLASKGYEEVAKIYPQLSYEYSSVKSSLVSLFQAYNGTSGYVNPLTNEAQVNDLIPKTGMPTTTCHEISHQIGWAAENDANFIGFLTSVHHKDLYFQYSGYRMAFAYLMREVYKRDRKQSNAFWRTVNKGIVKDFNNSRKHWKKYENPIEPYFKKGYNAYLKANNQTKGIQSYNYVVDLLIAYLKTKS